jgi:hypothetical protein
MPLFSNRQESNLRSCIQMVEDVIASLGHPPDESRIETASAMPAWRVKKGSAWVTVSISGDEDDNHLHVAAKVLVLDAAVDRASLFQRLLELNAGEIKGAAFALAGDDVLLLTERSTIDLDLSEVQETIRRLETYADHWDDALIAEFGGVRAGDLP